MSKHAILTFPDIVNVIGVNASTEFVKPYLLQDQIDALSFYEYADYSGLKGAIWWINGKPVIGGRYNFWEGFENATSLAAKLNRLPRNIHSVDSYSWIPVHAWSRTVQDILDCVALLDEGVRVVAPDHFVTLLKNNVN